MDRISEKREREENKEMKKRWKKISVAWMLFFCVVVPIVRPNMIVKAEEQSETKVVYYENIAEFRAVTGYKPPTKAGYTFAGWYTTEDCVNPITTTDPNVSAYAKFVSDKILCTKAQISNSYTASGTKYRSIRFITSVDSLNYLKVGFKFEINGETYDCASDKVYSKLYAIGASSGNVMKFTPQSAFCEQSTHFKTWTYTYIPEGDFGTKIKATPYWITQDGTYVSGEGDVKSIDLGILSAKMKSSSAMTATSYTEKWGNVSQPWDSTNAANGYTPQGGYTDGMYYYQAFIECIDGLKENTNVCIAQYDMQGNYIQKITGLKLDHANDITYNSKLGKFLVSHAYPEYTKITYFTLEDSKLKLGETITIDYEIISIAYNEAKDQYVVGLKGTQDFRILDAEFHALTEPIKANVGSKGCTTQGVSCDEVFIYFVLFKPNVIMVYEWDGDFVTKIDLETIISSVAESTSVKISWKGTKGDIDLYDYEPENISVIGNEIYIGCKYNNSYQYEEFLSTKADVDSFTVFKLTLDNMR